MSKIFSERLELLEKQYEELIHKKNFVTVHNPNGAYQRYQHPILTAGHVPLAWRYDLNAETNPWLMERFGINSVMNAGAIKLDGRYLVMARVEGVNRKSFFAIAESSNGIDQFRFWDQPVVIPARDVDETNIYDVRLTKHADGWIYGLFCTEKKDPSAATGDQSSAIAQCGIARTRDMLHWERLKDLVTPSAQQRNVVLHPELVSGQYAFYTRPQDNFIEAGEGGGIGFGLSDSVEGAVIRQELIIDKRIYHTVAELKNGQGPAPIRTRHGWLHLAHGVRNTAAGLRYALYIFMTDLNDLTRVIHKPGGYLIAPENEERVGDVSNVVFSNGWIEDENGKVFIYYASSDTRMHVAVSSVDQLVDYAMNTFPDGFTSASNVDAIQDLIRKNKPFIHQRNDVRPV